jgi:hypothetical protein
MSIGGPPVPAARTTIRVRSFLGGTTPNARARYRGAAAAAFGRGDGR